MNVGKTLFAQIAEAFGGHLSNTVYALDATTIDLCLSVFPWAPFRSTKAAVKLHTLLDHRCPLNRRNVGSTVHPDTGFFLWPAAGWGSW